MLQIPDRSNRLKSLRSSSYIILAVMSLGMIIALFYNEPTNKNKPTIAALEFLFLLIFSLALLVIRDSISHLSRYETFRQLYEAYRSNPTQKTGQELYSHYLSFNKTSSLEDKIMNTAMRQVLISLQ